MLSRINIIEAFYLNCLTWFIVVVNINRNRLYQAHVIFPVKLNIHAKFTVIGNLRNYFIKKDYFI